MFLPKNFTDAVNGNAVFSKEGDRVRFTRKASTLPTVAGDGVLRWSTTGKGGTYIKGKRLGVVGLAMVDAQRAKRGRTIKAITKSAVAAIPAQRNTGKAALSAAEAMRNIAGAK